VPGILHVCLANRARSALAEFATRAALARCGLSEAIPVAGAGTWTRGGERVWEPAGREARRRGWDPAGFRSRRLEPAMVREADLVLAATRALRDEVIALVPAALRRTFTWRELTWLLDGAGPDELAAHLATPPAAATPLDRLGAVPALARARRGHLPVPPAESFDVVDPADGTPGASELAADHIERCVAVLVGIVAGQGAVGAPATH